ncbi:hypothetical protein INT48_002734 [Thamnidium elegans]|uniref:RBR-type E3 ubiquitin transferase n=1 Tax=Thamnidium elegans TaxID=101142 RepID=A0A8H7SIJ2_9FUNG|nr:hypothetical protein INT48_002734 [Thamnidium elegans]
MSSLYLEKKKAHSLIEKSNVSLGSLIFGNLFKQKTSNSKAKKDIPVFEKETLAPVVYYQCVICMDQITSGTYFSRNIGSCDHQACIGCTRSYFMNSLKDDRYNKSYESIECPAQNCQKKFITSKFLSSILSNQEADEWSVVLRKTCHRGFCMACQEKWHPGVIKIVSDEEALERTLIHAQKKMWSRCPKCLQFVERMGGCLDIRCRCGISFCYRCGGQMLQHNVCARQCNNFTETELASVRKSMFASKPTIA